MEKSKLRTWQEGKSASHIKNAFKRLLAITIIFCIAFSSPVTVKVSSADSTTQVKVDYAEEMVYVTGASTKFYFSVDGKKTWDLIDAGVLDISSILSSKEILIYFKGNKDTTPVEYKLQAEDKTSLTVAYKIISGTGRIEFVSSSAVEYRKGANGAWKTATNLMSTSLYEIKGTTLYFRTVANAGKRAGKIVNIKVPKRPSAPQIKVDGSKLCLTGLKSGETQYRIGDGTTWLPYTSSTNAKTIDLSAMLGGSTTGNTPIPAGVIEFRTVGSDKKLNSAVKVVEVPLQATMTTAFASVTGSALAILDPDAKKAYEYTIVAKDQSLNMSTAKWTTVTSKKAVIVPRVAIGDKVLVRIKSTVDATSKQVIPASTYIVFPISSITTS